MVQDSSSSGTLLSPSDRPEDRNRPRYDRRGRWAKVAVFLINMDRVWLREHGGGKSEKGARTRPISTNEKMDSVDSGNLARKPTQSAPKNRGQLRNGNPPGDPSKSPRCNALTQAGTRCQCPAMWSEKAQQYTRCRLHGGASRGPRTAASLARSRIANLRHGRYTAEAKARRREIRDRLQLVREEQFASEQILSLLERKHPSDWAAAEADPDVQFWVNILRSLTNGGGQARIWL